jgi:hypothetical protein
MIGPWRIEPWAYPRDVLTLLPTWPNRDVLQRVPKFWDHTRQQPQTQQRLAAARLLGRFDEVQCGRVYELITALASTR